MWSVDISSGDKIVIGSVVITLLEKTGRRARVSISTDHGLPMEIVPANKNEPKKDAAVKFSG